jgi:NADH-quinone oxidoreductase subunit G
MNVVDLCPVGALTSADFRFKERVWFLKSANSICHGCAKGCNIYIDHNKEKYKDDMIYRYRPRVNKTVNGWFICNDGRLSYHKENKNRQSVACVASGEISIKDALQATKELLIKHQNKTLFVVSPSLSLEDMYAIKVLANKYGALIETNADSYIHGEDDTTMARLIKSDKAANRKGAELLGFATGSDSYKNALSNASCIVIFDHKCLSEQLDLANKACVIFTTNITEHSKKADVTIPIASYSEKDGLIINCDNILQHYDRAVTKNVPMPILTELIGNIAEEDLAQELIRSSLAKSYETIITTKGVQL